MEPVKLYLVAEFEPMFIPGRPVKRIEEARIRLDYFRESVLPSQNYGITITELTPDVIAEGVRNPAADLVGKLLEVDDYQYVIEKFNALSHDDKFLALSDAGFRGYLRRATGTSFHWLGVRVI